MCETQQQSIPLKEFEFKCPPSLQRDYELIMARIDSTEASYFNQFCSFYDTEQDLNTLFIRYRHLISEFYESNWGVQNHATLQRPVCIGYMLNPDMVFYNELDQVICNFLQNEGAQVVQFRCDQVRVKASSQGGLEFYIDDYPAQFDAFLSYGYRSKMSMNAYLNVVKVMEQMGVVVLHSHENELVMSNKMVQSIIFSTNNIPIPDTYQVYAVPSAKQLASSELAESAAVIKSQSDYGGDNMYKVDDYWNLVNAVAKNLWKGEQHVILQRMVPDSLGQSIRVLCIDGEAFAILRFQTLDGDFRSNFSCNKNRRDVSLHDDPKAELYKQVAEKAMKAVGDLVIGGVDLLDSERDGVVVLEINSWPDVFDTWLHTRKCTFKRLAQVFMQKVNKSINAKKLQQMQSP